jgi:hypothetical protein
MSQPKVDWSQYELRTEESAAPATPATDWSQFELRQDEPPAPIEDQVSRTATRVERQGPVNDDQVAREQRRIAREQRIAARKAPTSEGFDPSIAGDQLMSGVTAMQQGFFTNNAKLASSQLNVFDRIDAGEQVQDTDDPVGYAHMDPEQRRVARASMQQSRPPATRARRAATSATRTPRSSSRSRTRASTSPPGRSSPPTRSASCSSSPSRAPPTCYRRSRLVAPASS